MTAIHAQTERKLQERFARCAEKHHRRARTRRLRGLIRSVPAVARAAGDAQDGKGLPNDPVQAIFTSGATPLGECRVRELRDCLMGILSSIKTMMSDEGFTPSASTFPEIDTGSVAQIG
jgi:hypothetical protein